MRVLHELVFGDSHGLVARMTLGPIVLPPEGDGVLVVGDETAVGDRDPVGVAREIGEHSLGP